MRKLSLEKILKNKGTRILVITTPTNNSYPKDAINFVIENFRNRIKDDSLVDDIRVAAGEMIANAIDHGNIKNQSKNLKIYCSWFEDKFYFVVQDGGEGFDIDNLKYQGFPQPEGGLGIAYAKQRVDLVYNFRDSASYLCKMVRANNLA